MRHADSYMHKLLALELECERLAAETSITTLDNFSRVNPTFM